MNINKLALFAITLFVLIGCTAKEENENEGIGLTGKLITLNKA